MAVATGGAASAAPVQERQTQERLDAACVHGMVGGRKLEPDSAVGISSLCLEEFLI